MKYYKGQQVYCVNNDNEWFTAAMLEVGKLYIIEDINPINNVVYLKDIILYGYDEDRFMSLEEFRRDKINKIRERCSKLEIK